MVWISEKRLNLLKRTRPKKQKAGKVIKKIFNFCPSYKENDFDFIKEGYKPYPWSDREITKKYPQEPKRSLVTAVISNNNDEVMDLISDEKGWDWQLQLDHCLYVAVEGKQEDLVKILLENGASVHQSTEWFPLIATAVETGHSGIVDLILEKHTKEEIAGGFRFPTGTLLHAAVRSRCLPMVQKICKLFQENSTNLNTKCELEEFTPLHLAVRTVSLRLNQQRHEQLEQVESLDNTSTQKRKRDQGEVSSNCVIKLDKELTNTIDCDTKSTDAVLLHDLDILSFLLSQKLDVDCRDLVGQTPLHKAAAMGYTEEVEMLIANGADPLILDTHLNIAWMYACEFKHEDTMKALMRHIDVNCASIEGRKTPLHLACARGSQPCVNILLDKGADVNITDEDGYTPFLCAVREQQTEVVEQMLSRQLCDVNQVHSGCKSALSIIMKRNFEACKKMLDLLLKAGVDVDIRDSEGHTQLMKHEVQGESRQWLLDHGADINAIGKDGLTVLWAATYLDCCDGRCNNIMDMLKMNIDMGNSNLKYKGQTPLMHALSKQCNEQSVLLLNAGCSRSCALKEMGKLWNMSDEQRMVMERLQRECCHPLALQDLARQAVLRSMGSGETVDFKIDQLTVPIQIKNFLTTDTYIEWNQVETES